MSSDTIPEELLICAQEFVKLCKMHGIKRDTIIAGVAWDGDYVKYSSMMSGIHKEKHRIRTILDI
jgi:hypothetical protein